MTPLRVGQEAFWLEQIARDACEYYAGKGESPGWWLGSLADRAGLQGKASEEAVQRLFAGQGPGEVSLLIEGGPFSSFWPIGEGFSAGHRDQR